MEGIQPGLVREQLPDSDAFFALLGKLRPVRADALVVIKQAPRMGQRHGQAGHPLGGGVHYDHRILFPGLAGGLVADAAPQVHDFFPTVVNATGGPQLVPVGEVLDEGFSHGLKPRLDKTRYRSALYLRHDIAPYRCTIYAYCRMVPLLSSRRAYHTSFTPASQLSALVSHAHHKMLVEEALSKRKKDCEGIP